MNWLPIALATALLTATSDALTKAYLKPLGTIKMAIGRVIAPIFFLAPLLFYTGFPHLDSTFWKTLLLLLPLETAALLLYMKALRVSPLSLTLPFLAFTPAFMILTGALILGEHLKAAGIAGIMLIVSGSYTLYLPSLRHGLTEPIRAMFREQGSILMLAVAFIYSITSVLGKLAIQHSNPTFFASFYFIIHGVFATCVLALIFRTNPKEVLERCPKGVLLVGLAQSAMVISHMWAISLAPAAYMIAVKRTSVLFGVLIGCLFFKEPGLGFRLLGAALMVAGVFLICLG